jgi:hypothetical protein
MCSTDGGGHHAPDGESASSAAFLANWRQPGSLRWKLQRVVVNTSIKLLRRQRCCGNGGEPGC